ncbi:MAG: penicillin-binding protein 2 [Rhodospirillum sp.]|nr:penicillin-binding protein 2 [Rhodospirillum sp.]MCF8488796.1 penicillin-binding protein 2 [Rhodospirillum sp.]MCF8502220.1 penicillin-binding protein 2 [Rhodospirillum sp.]
MMGLFQSRRNRFVYPGAEIRSSTGGSPARLDGENHRIVEMGRTRLMVAACLFGLAFTVIGGRLVELMALGEPGEPPVATLADEPLETRMARADIVDRDGLVLATNLPTVHLYADTRAIPEKDRLRAIGLLPTLFPELTTEELNNKLVPGKAFVNLRYNLTPIEQQAVNDLGIPGLNFERAERRVYPAGRLVAHVVGATDVDGNGIAGLEKAFDARLTGEDIPLRLSLDLRVQHVAHRALSDSIDHFKAVGGTALVMDVNTAEVLALVSLPDYEPEKIGSTGEDARFNQATLGVFEMGSTFKLFNSALGLENGMQLTDSFDARHPIQIGGFTIHDFHAKGTWLTLPEILQYSSNIGSARLATTVGTEKQRAFLERLGLLDPVPFELPEVGRPLVPNPWREINTMTIAYGHGLAVTPLQTITAVSALVNGGLLRPPTLLRRAPRDIPPGKQVISAENSGKMRALMRLVVESGSGRNADVKGYYVGGKTGSADKLSKVGGYSNTAVRTSFIAVFPMTDPKYVVLVMLDDPKAVPGTSNLRTAGWNATPTAGRIVAEIAPILGVAPQEEDPTVAFDAQVIQQVGLRSLEPLEGPALATR